MRPNTDKEWRKRHQPNMYFVWRKPATWGDTPCHPDHPVPVELLDNTKKLRALFYARKIRIVPGLPALPVHDTPPEPAVDAPILTQAAAFAALYGAATQAATQAAPPPSPEKDETDTFDDLPPSVVKITRRVGTYAVHLTDGAIHKKQGKQRLLDYLDSLRVEQAA